MKTYNTNPGYEMEPQLLTHFNQHLDSLFGVYSKLLPFRMDFAYRKNTLSYRCACRYAMCAEILRLINEVGEKLVGYACGFAPIFPDICYHLTHYKPAAADIPVASDNPAHYADAIRYNARTPLQGSLLPLTRLVWA